MLRAATQLIAMSTYSLVGAVVPVAAAGSLFAGFMSVTNLAYTFSYSSGAWLYDHGMSLAPLRRRAAGACSGSRGGPADKLSLNMLILFGALAYFASFLAVHLLPERGEATLAGDGGPAAGPERWLVLAGRACGGRRTGARSCSASAVLAGLTLRAEDRSGGVGADDVPGRVPGPQVVAGRAVTPSRRGSLSRS